MFVSFVYNSDALSDFQKFFRKLALFANGDSEKAIQCFQTIAENYSIAWQRLIERYNNNKLLVQVHTKSLYLFMNYNLYDKSMPTSCDNYVMRYQIILYYSNYLRTKFKYVTIIIAVSYCFQNKL